MPRAIEVSTLDTLSTPTTLDVCTAGTACSRGSVLLIILLVLAVFGPTALLILQVFRVFGPPVLKYFQPSQYENTRYSG